MEATELNHGTAFQWKAWSTYRFSPHCVCIFLLYFLPTWTFLSFSFLSTTPYIGKFVYYVSAERDQRWTAGMHRTDGTQKGTLFYTE